MPSNNRAGHRPADSDSVNMALYTRFMDELTRGLSTLADKPEETPDTTLRALWHLANGNHLSVEAAAETALPPLDGEGELRLAALIRTRTQGVPLAHLTGRQRFMGLELLAGKEALIPRRETELLARGAIEVLRDIAKTQARPLVVDVCTGSGNLAVAMAHHVIAARVYAADLSEEAVALARRNARHLGLEDRIEVHAGDLLTPFELAGISGKADLLTCNPPYISSKKVDSMPEEIAGFEPRLAFDGGPLGIKIVQRLLREAPRFLKPGGYLAFEVGLGQGPGIRKRIDGDPNFTEVRALEDGEGNIRALIARTVRA